MTSLRTLALLCLLIALPCAGVSAQDYPNRPVKIIVPFGAGGPADVFARVLAQHLSDSLKQSFVSKTGPVLARSLARTRSRSHRPTAIRCSPCPTPTPPMNH